MHLGCVKKPIEPNPLIRKSYIKLHFLSVLWERAKEDGNPYFQPPRSAQGIKKSLLGLLYFYCDVMMMLLNRWEISLFFIIIGICLSGKGSKETMAYALKPAKQLGADEGPEQIHKIRITLTSKSVKNLEKGTQKTFFFFCCCLLHWFVFVFVFVF